MTGSPAGRVLESQERLRLDALRSLQIVGTPPEAHFDAVVSLAKTVFDVPIVLISLMEEDRQWFKARCGLDVDGTSRDVAFCDYAIQSDAVFVVEDATKDPRFAANPLVVGAPGIRFYAGAPLVLRPGIRVGTVCIIDTKPRVSPPAESHKLAEFATVVIAYMRLYEANALQRDALTRQAKNEALVRSQADDLAKRETSLRDSNRLLLLAEEIAQAGHWHFDVVTRERQWSPETYRIFGRDPVAATPLLDEPVNGYHPDDQARVRAIVADAVQTGESFAFDARVIRPDGSIRHVSVRGIGNRDENDTLQSFFGVMIDITDRKQVEERLHLREHELTTVINNIPALIGYVDKDLKLKLANKTYVQWYGKSIEYIQGRHISEILGDEIYNLNIPMMEAALLGEAKHFERVAFYADIQRQRHTAVSYLPDIRNGEVHGLFVFVTDVTAQKHSEDRLKASLAFQDRAGRVAGVGAWELDLATQAVTFSHEAFKIHDLDPGTRLNTSEALDFYPPDARIVVQSAINQGVETGTPWDFRLPFVTAKGRAIWVRAAGEAEFKDGKAVRLVGVIQDVTDQHEAELALRTKEAQYRLLAENASDMITRIDLTGTRLYVSPASYDLLGYTPEELVGTRPVNAIHPEDAPRFLAMMEGLKSGTRLTDSITNRLRHKNGAWVWVEANWRVLRDNAGQAIEFVAAVRDVRERREAEERVKASETLYRTLAGSLPQIVWIFNANDRKTSYGNAQFYDYYGAIGDTVDDRLSLVHPDDAPALRLGWEGAQRKDARSQIEIRLRRHDGVYRWHKFVVTPIRQVGPTAEWLGTALDIDDIVVARQKLMEASDLLSLSQEAAGAGVFDIDLLSGFAILSGASVPMHGYAGEQPVTIHLNEWIARVDPDDGARALVLVDEACASGNVYSAEFRVLLDDGAVRWVHGTGRARYDASGRAVRMVGLNFDVTARKIAEEKLLQAITAADTARREAEQASVAKSEFLASMSHEIRTPLSSILGYTDILLDGDHHRAEDRRKLTLIQDSGAALLTVVNDILDFSKIEAGHVGLEPETFPLLAFIDNVLSIIGGIAIQKGLSMDHDIAPDVPKYVTGDVNRLRQVLLNLMNNAVKFTLAGSVKLTVSTQSGGAGSIVVRFIVSDTGIGITPEQKTRLFQRFSQADGSIGRRFGGSGLGLAISKTLVDLMGGEIGCDSVAGEGSSFWFQVVLPLAAEPNRLPETAKDQDKHVRSARILLVEDVPINQDLARIILETEGYHVEVASDGAAAIRKVQDSDFDLVLMDVQMPGMDGLTATQHIRTLAAPRGTLPIVAMTANVLPQQIAEFKAVGMNDYVGKPFKRAELFGAIERWARRPSDAGRSTPESETPDGAVSGEPPMLDRRILDDLRDMVGDVVCRALVTKFAREVETRFGAISSIIDRDVLRRNAHAMISSSGSLGFMSFSDLCREVETACRDGDDVAKIQGSLWRASRRVLAEILSLP